MTLQSDALTSSSNATSWSALNEAPDGTLSVPEPLGRPPSAVRLLVIDLGALPRESRHCVRFQTREQSKWLSFAASRGVTLVVLDTEDRIELYSTEVGYRRAFRSVIQALSARVFEEPDLGLARTHELGDDSAVRHLLRRAAGLEPERSQNLRLLGQLESAAVASSAVSALGATLGPLFGSAAKVGHRVRNETALGDPAGTPASREVERLAAERILEEEFASFQSLERERHLNELKESPAPAPSRSFVAEEPGSFLRVLVAQRLDRSGNF